MDKQLQEKVNQIVANVKADSSLLMKIKEDPVKAAKEVLGVDLPPEGINAVRASLEDGFDLSDVAGIAGAVGGMFDDKK